MLKVNNMQNQMGNFSGWLKAQKESTRNISNIEQQQS